MGRLRAYVQAWVGCIQCVLSMCTFFCIPVTCMWAFLHREPLRAFPCHSFGSGVPGTAARQLSAFHRLEPSVGWQSCSHTPASALIFIELTSLTDLLEHLKLRTEEGTDRRTNEEIWGEFDESVTVRGSLKTKSWFGSKLDCKSNCTGIFL